jgi:hypothetical protein
MTIALLVATSGGTVCCGMHEQQRSATRVCVSGCIGLRLPALRTSVCVALHWLRMHLERRGVWLVRLRDGDVLGEEGRARRGRIYLIQYRTLGIADLSTTCRE